MILLTSRQTHLEDEGGSWLQLQNGGSERLEPGVGIVAEALVDHQQREDVIHNEADLIRTGSCLRYASVRIRARHGRRQADHHRVIEHCTVLTQDTDTKFIVHKLTNKYCSLIILFIN